MPTKKLFWDDPYQTECTAIVTEVNDNKVKLNQTIFYAFSGGQESDEGTIEGIKVVEAVKQGDKENIINIEYTLEREPDFKVGDEVTVKIDAERRKKLMKLHSATHIVYYFFIEKVGRQKIIGSNIAAEKARIDFLYDQPIQNLLPEIEEAVNVFLSEDHVITRKADEKSPDLRWWVCKDWKMPCGGTHPRSTKEIGQIQLKRKNLGKGKERIEIFLRN
ncbi:alanyl-tRNA editing protein, partial [Patescibacteria group bacterium]|nr:alanyl-tRNA editing protein [Patescibacteria group bacterium]